MADLGKPQAPLELNELVKEEIRSKLKEQNLEYRTKIVEEAMTPFIDEVTSISEYDQKKKKTKPQKLSKLIHLVDMATRHFLMVGEEIAHENPDFQEELLFACDDVRSHGELLQAAAAQFSQSPCELDNRSKMTKASKDLLLAVTRLLVVADMADVNKLLEASSRVEMRLRSLHTATSENQAMDIINKCSSDISHITQRASIQPNEERSEGYLQLLTTAQVEVKQAKRMLACTSKAFIQFSGAKEAKENQEYVVLRLLDSLKTLSLLASGDDFFLTDVIQAELGELVVCFKRIEENLDKIVSLLSSPTFLPQMIEVQVTNIQEDLEKILVTSSELASSQSTRDYRQHALITLCKHLKTSMGQLVSIVRDVCEEAQQPQKRRVVSDIVTDVGVRASELQRELCKVAVDQVCDVFMNTRGPLVSMCETAQEGHEKMLKQRATIFEDHTDCMRKTALLLCSLSDYAKSNRQVKIAVRHIHTLLPQVVNAAYILARKPSSIVALKGMSVFKETWSENVSALIDAVDSITPIVEFMAATEALVCEDAQDFIMAVETCNTRLLDSTVDVIRNRCKRLCHVVKAELRSNKSSYTQDQSRQSHGAMEKLKTKSLSKFCEQATKADEILHMTGDIYRVDFKGLENSLQRVVDNVRNVRRSILVTRAPEELEENESDLEDLLRPPRPLTPTLSLLSQLSASSASTIMGGQGTQQPKFYRTPQHSAVFEEEDTTKSMMSQLSAEHQAHLAKATEGLTAQHAVFEAEVNKWDESGSDIVMIAKEMCSMMVDMSDFARGIGPLHSTTDVIVTAKDIARAAGILDGEARSIADHCPDTQCQRDIYAYLDKIHLYCNQLNITANVKADLQSSANDAVENTSTLIATSKNLMTAVVDTVKSCYIASTAIARTRDGSVSGQFVQWRLTLPRKKKLYRSDSEMSDIAEERSAALHELSKFKGRPREPKMPTLTEIPHQTRLDF